MRDLNPRRLLLVVALAALGSLALASSALGANHAYKFSFGSATSTPANPYPLTEQQHFEIAIDNSGGPSDGDIYALDAANLRTEKFDSEGNLILIFGNEVNKTASEDPGSTEQEENVCVIASGDICQNGVSTEANDGIRDPSAIAVDSSNGPSSGDIYIADQPCCIGGFVTKWDENGHQVKTWGEKEGRKSIFLEYDLGVDPISGDLFVVGNGEIERYDEAGTKLTHFVFPGRSEGTGFDIDQDGTLYQISGGFEPPRGLLKFSQSGSLIAEISQEAFGLTVDQSSDDVYSILFGQIAQFDGFCGNTCSPDDAFGGAQEAGRSLAIGKTNEALYVKSRGNEIAVFESLTPTVTGESFDGADETSADFTATIDPNGHGPITDCEFQYGSVKSITFTDSIPCAETGPFATPQQVTAHVEGLAPGTAFRYRFVATSASAFRHGLDHQFRTASAPQISSFTSSHVTATSAELSARIIPGGAPTKYHFEYGPTPTYGSSAPIPDGEITEGLFDEQAVATEIELNPELRYHFRLVAENEYGTTVSEDQTFGFYPPRCPNQAVRQQTGANDVPDCRGYELVTPEFSGNAVIFPAGSTPNLGRATSPSRLGYGTWGGIIPGIEAEPPNTIGDQYVSTRTNAGWKSKYIGLPSTVARLSGGPPYRNEQTKNWEPDKYQQGVLADPGMDRLVDWNGGQFDTLETQFGEPLIGQGPGKFSSNAPYVWDATTGKQLDRWPTNVGAVPGGVDFQGETIASGDLSHFVFSSDIPFVNGGEPGDIYDNNTQTGDISIVSRDANGDPISASPARVSDDGQRILMSSPKVFCGGEPGASWTCSDPLTIPVQLYMRVGGITKEIAPGNLVNYVGMTNDATRIYFTSTAKLTSEDTDSSRDLFMWSEAGDVAGEPLTLVSVSNDGSTGNSDGCNASWTADCNVLPIDFAKYCRLQGGLGGNCVSDRSIAEQSGDIYFFSPDKLDGSFGITDAANLYRFHDGDVNFVATLSSAPVCTPVQSTPYCSESPIARMNISPKGDHVSFITTSKLTQYDNSGHAMMYSYTPATHEITCDSCRPDGLPPTAETFGSQNGLFMTDDGRTFFSTKDALVSPDTNQGQDIYEFSEGRPQLISSGTAQENETFGFTGIETFPGLASVSADGTDVYFVTYDVFVGQDQNGEELKIYDARANGGFPFVKPQPECGAADECHGAGSSATPIPSNGTGAGLGGRGNAEEAAPKKKSAAKKKKKSKKKKQSRKKRHAKRTGGQQR